MMDRGEKRGRSRGEQEGEEEIAGESRRDENRRRGEERRTPTGNEWLSCIADSGVFVLRDTKPFRNET